MNARVLHSIREVDAESWDSLCGGDVVFSHAWLRALEDSRVPPAEPRHVALEENGRLVGAVPCFLQRGDPYATLVERLLGPLARSGPDRALVAYSPLAQRSALLAAPGCGAAVAREACQVMGDVCAREGLALSGWPFVGRDPELSRSLRSAGYRPVFLAPSARFENPGYASFEAYLEHLRRPHRSRYRDIRNERSRFARSKIEIRDLALSDVDPGELAALQARHYARHNPGTPPPFSSAFFASLSAALGEDARAHVATRSGERELLSYSIVLRGRDRWHMFLCGDRDTESAHADKLHFNLNYYYPMERAIEARVARLDYGLSGYAMKLRRGCALEPVHMWVRGHAVWSRAALPAWLRVVDLRYRRKHAGLPVDLDAPDARRAATCG